MQKLNDKEIISNIISDMNLYNVDYVIVMDLSKAKKYNQMMSKKILEHLSKNEIKILKKKDHDDDDDDDANEEENEEYLNLIMNLLKSESTGLSEDDYDQVSSLKYEIEDEDNSIAKFAHFLTDYEIRKLQIEKKEAITFKINGQNYKGIPIESLILNLVYLSLYEEIENSLANEFKFIDQILQVLNPKTAHEMVKKDIILYLSKINNSDIDENEKKLIKSNVNKIFDSEKLDINNLSLNIVYNTEYRKRKVQYDIIMNEYTKIIIAKEHVSKIINNKIIQIENNFKYILKTKTRAEIEECKNIINTLASKILTISDSGNGFKIVHNQKKDRKIVEEVTVIDKILKNRIYSKESLDYDDKLISDDYNTITKCNINYSIYNNYAEKIKLVDINQLHMSEIYLKDIKESSNKEIQITVNQIILSIKRIQEISNKSQSIDEPFLPQINTDINLESSNTFSDILIIGNSEKGIKLLNEIDYNLGKRMQNSLFRINMFNLTNNKISTIPKTNIRQFDDQVIIQTKLTEQPKIYLRFSHPIKIENKSIYIKGEIDRVFSIDIFSDSSSLYYILILDENDSEFTRNQIEDKKININDTMHILNAFEIPFSV